MANENKGNRGQAMKAIVFPEIGPTFRLTGLLCILVEQDDGQEEWITSEGVTANRAVKILDDLPDHVEVEWTESAQKAVFDSLPLRT